MDADFRKWKKLDDGWLVVRDGETLGIFCGKGGFLNVQIRAESIKATCNSGTSFNIFSMDGNFIETRNIHGILCDGTVKPTVKPGASCAEEKGRLYNIGFQTSKSIFVE